MHTSGVRRAARPRTGVGAEAAAVELGGARTGTGRRCAGREPTLAQAPAGVGDDADPARHVEVPGQGTGVDRRPEALGAGGDDVDRAGGQRLGGGLGRGTGEHDGGRAARHDVLDDLQAAGGQGEVEQHGVGVRGRPPGRRPRRPSSPRRARGCRPTRAAHRGGRAARGCRRRRPRRRGVPAPPAFPRPAATTSRFALPVRPPTAGVPGRHSARGIASSRSGRSLRTPGARIRGAGHLCSRRPQPRGRQGTRRGRRRA